jgi:hypothetical protein
MLSFYFIFAATPRSPHIFPLLFQFSFRTPRTCGLVRVSNPICIINGVSDARKYLNIIYL